MLKRTIVCILFFLAVAFFFIPQETPGFSLSSAMPRSTASWNLHAVSEQEIEEIKAVLSQKFIYSGCGAQVYVFFSKDGSSVIKLFKKKRFEVPLWIRLLPPNPYKARKLASKRAKVVREFSSCQIAFNELFDETALLLVHLDKKIDQVVTLIDGEGRSYEANLGDYAFILQRKGELVYPYVEKLVREGDLQAAKQALLSLTSLLKERCLKGVDDTHPNFGKNFAFIEGKAVQIDIGRFSHEKVKVPQISKAFKVWLRNLSPELYDDPELADNFLLIDGFAERSS